MYAWGLGVSMERGRLQLAWQEFTETETVALIIPRGKGAEHISLLRRLISEASSSYSQLSELHLAPIPLPPSELESWVYWLAAEVIGQWRNLPVESFSVEVIIEQLGLTTAENATSLLTALDKGDTNIPLSKELALRIQALQVQYQQKLEHSHSGAWLELEATKLSKWFSQVPSLPLTSSESKAEPDGCLTQLQSNAIALRSQVLHTLQESLVQLGQAGPRAALKWLKSLTGALQVIRNNYEAQRQECLQRESSAWQAYSNLSAKPGKRKWVLFGPRMVNREAALRALGVAYHSRLEAEIYTLASQLVGELAQQTNVYATAIAQTDALLMNLQDWFTERCPSKLASTPLLRDYLVERVNLLKLLRELEHWTDCSLEQWGALESTQSEALREQILARIQPLCLEMYVECCCSVLASGTPDLAYTKNGNWPLVKLPSGDAPPLSKLPSADTSSTATL